jgi:hypothetical protein
MDENFRDNAFFIMMKFNPCGRNVRECPAKWVNYVDNVNENVSGQLLLCSFLNTKLQFLSSGEYKTDGIICICMPVFQCRHLSPDDKILSI